MCKRKKKWDLFSSFLTHTCTYVQDNPKVALLFHRYSFQFRNRRQTEDPSICLSRSILQPLPLLSTPMDHISRTPVHSWWGQRMGSPGRRQMKGRRMGPVSLSIPWGSSVKSALDTNHCFLSAKVSLCSVSRNASCSHLFGSTLPIWDYLISILS